MPNKIQFSLSTLIIKEGKSFVAYSPALDLSTVGDTFDEAKNRFEEAVEIFFEETQAKGTLEEALKELGWQKDNNKCYQPPVIVAHTTQKYSCPNYLH